MTESVKDKNMSGNEDQQRLVIAIGIVAAAIAIFAMSDVHKSASGIIGGFILFPAILSFMFIILTAAHLKFNGVDEVGVLDIPTKLHHLSYDWAINGFWTSTIAIVVAIVAILFGWDGRLGTAFTYWPSLFISVTFLGVLVVIMAIIKSRETKATRRAVESKKTRKVR